MAEFPKIALVLGGVSSGKSAFAERLVRCANLPKTYVATAQGGEGDGEMQAKIARHQQMRGADWHTMETPLDLVGALTDINLDQIILVDCLTLWLSNHMFAKSNLNQTFDRLVAALDNRHAPVVLVSNEVGLGGISDTPIAREFQKNQGQLNHRVAAISGLVVMVTAGLPHSLKGQIPKGAQ